MALDPRVLQAVERAENFVLQVLDHVGKPNEKKAKTQPEGVRLPPGPPQRRGRILGSLAYYLNFLDNPIGFVGKRFATYGDIYYAPSATRGLYAICRPEHVYQVLVTQAAHYTKTHTALEQMRQVLGTGLLTSDGAYWKRHRRMMQPAFSQARLAAYSTAMTQEAVRAVQRLMHKTEHDIAQEMMEITLRAVCSTLFSHDIGTDVSLVGQSMASFQDALVIPNLFPRWIETPQNKRLRQNFTQLDQLLYRMIEERRQHANHTPAKHPDLLQMLMDAVDEEGDGKKLTEKEIRDELITLLLAGHETTANTLTWTLYLLSQNPDVEAKLHHEVDTVLMGRPPTYHDLDKLPYSELVIKESLRLYPPAFSIARQAHETTQIGDYTVPAGSEVILWIYFTHRDERCYPEPERFLPERFTPSEEAKLPKLAYAPFGAGPRVCIGKNFAMMEARLILTTLVQSLKFELVSGHQVEVKPRITLCPKYGMKMLVKSRRHSGQAVTA